MYNIDFLAQLERFRRDLFGAMPSSPALPYAEINPLAQLRLRGHGPDDTYRYVPPPGVKVLDCREDVNGEWVPDPAQSSGDRPADEGSD